MNVMGETQGYYNIIDGPIELKWVEFFQERHP